MNKIKLKYHFAFTVIALIILSNQRLLQFAEYIYDIIVALISSASTQSFIPVDIRLDYFISFIAFIGIIIYIIFFWNSSWLNKKLKLSSSIIFFVISGITFYPLISGSQTNIDRESIKISKMPPFTCLNYFTQLDERNNLHKKLNGLFEQNDGSIYIYFDSYKIGERIEYSFNSEVYFIEKNVVRSKKNMPVVSLRFFILGTDEFGNDLFTEIIYGIRKSFFVAAFASFLSLLIGSILGYYSGTHTGFTGIAINRFSESIFSIPSILLFIIILIFYGSSTSSIAVVMGLTGWITIFKIVRNEVIIIKQKEFYKTSELLGLSKTDLLRKELMPNISAPILIAAIFMFMNFIILESSLSFIGLGSDESYSSLGSIIQRGNYYLPKYYWITLFPTFALASILIVLNSIKDIIRKIIDPRKK